MKIKKIISASVICLSLLAGSFAQAVELPIRESAISTTTLPRTERSHTPEIERGKIRMPNADVLIPDFGEPQQKSAPVQNQSTPESTATISALSTNIIPNGDLESNQGNGLPASWKKGGYGNNTRTLTYPVTGSSGNGIRIDVTNYVSGDAKWHFNHIDVGAGTTYKFTNVYQSNTSSIVTVEYRMSDGSLTYKDIATLGPSSSFSSVDVDFTVPSGAVSLTIFHLLKSNGFLITDDYSLMENGSGGGGGPTDPSNYVSNPGFESGSTNPDSWSRGRWGTNSATFSYPVTGSGGGKAARVTMASRSTGDAKWYFSPLSLPPGTYTYSNEYIATVPTFVTLEIRHSNGSVTYQDLTQPPAASNWSPISAVFTVPSSAVGVTVFHLINRNGTLTIDNVAIRGGGSSGGGGGIFSTGAVTIRIDDNWLSQYQNAFPILDNAGLKATLYVVSRQIADNGFPGYMSRAQIQEVHSNGHEIGAHTRTHRDLATLSASEQQSEIAGSRTDILAWNVGPVRSFSYPFGSYTAQTIQIVKNAGFESSGSSNGGFVTPASDPYQLERRGMEISTTFAQTKQWIDDAIAQKKWLILTVHEVKGSCSDRYCITTQLFDQVVDYLVANQIKVVTISEGMASL